MKLGNPGNISEVTSSQIEDYSSTCKKSVCPDFDTNVPNGQWKCSLDRKPIPNNNFADYVECIFSCQSTDIPASAVIVCDNGQWRVL